MASVKEDAVEIYDAGLGCTSRSSAVILIAAAAPVGSGGGSMSIVANSGCRWRVQHAVLRSTSPLSFRRCAPWHHHAYQPQCMPQRTHTRPERLPPSSQHAVSPGRGGRAGVVTHIWHAHLVHSAQLVDEAIVGRCDHLCVPPAHRLQHHAHRRVGTQHLCCHQPGCSHSSADA